jgi:thiosulfate/3-mercaptopyruvate sulfurtransferase
MDPFVAAAWVRSHLDTVVLADVRWSLDGSQGLAQHLEQTLPGAVFVDLDTVLAAPPGPCDGRHPLPTPERFAAELGRLGIGVSDPVVAFDHGPGTVAARFVWMLRAIGQAAAVLEGGLAAWPGPRAPGGARRTPVARAPVPWPDDRLADADDVDRLRHAAGVVIVDARDAVRYRGEEEPVDARPGHVPGAVNLPASGGVMDGRLRTAWLREAYAAAGVLDADEVVAYCGSGVTACFDLLVLEHLGAGPGRLYPGSWSAWSADPARPAALGEARG